MKEKMVFGKSQCKFTPGKSCLTNLIAFYDKRTFWWYYDLDTWTTRWVKSMLGWLGKEGCTPFALRQSGIPQGSVPGSILFNIFISNLEEVSRIHSHQVYSWKQTGGPIHTLEGRMTIQRNLDRLEELAIKNFIKFKTNKCRVLRLERKGPWGDTGWNLTRCSFT